MGENNISLPEAILAIITEWSSDRMWYSYDDMHDILIDMGQGRHEPPELKKEIQKLKAKGLVFSATTFDDDTNLICGKGWFLTETYNK